MAEIITSPKSNHIVIKAKADAANDIIKKHALMASGVSLIPIVGVDTAAMTAVQYRMLDEMCKLYDIPFDGHQGRVIISSFLSSIVSRMTGYVVHKYLNTFSGFGALADNLTNAAVSGFFTAASGEIYKLHFEEGNPLETVDFSHFYNYFQDQISEGKLNTNTFSGVQSAFNYLT
jgi:uncharacterized protein (DUF697 family)